MEFIKEIKSYIKSWEVCAPPHVHIHCIDGWLINLASLEALWQDLQSHKVKYLLTRRLNQDCLENLYAKLRIRFGSCDHPSAYNFMKGLKSLMTHDLFSLPSTSNCEADESQFLDVISTWEPDYPLATSSDSDSDSEDTVVDRMPLVERNALVYIAGWTCKKFLRSHDCQNCRENLLDVSRQFDSSSKMFCFFQGGKFKCKFRLWGTFYTTCKCGGALSRSGGTAPWVHGESAPGEESVPNFIINIRKSQFCDSFAFMFQPPNQKYSFHMHKIKDLLHPQVEK